MSTKPGVFIVLYGTNNLGKSTQAGLLVERLKGEGFAAEYLKYPIYDLMPTGPRLNDILRSGQTQTMTELELQNLYSQNRRDYQKTLEQKLKNGITIIAEDYIGTGLAWGVTKGAPLEALTAQNHNLRREDIAILLDGEPFASGKEKNHLHESNDALMQRCRKVHQELAQKYGWHTISANQPINVVSEKIWQTIKSFLTKV